MFVYISKGIHRNTEVSGVFLVIKPYHTTTNGTGQIQVRTKIEAPFMVDSPRIKVSNENFYYCDDTGEALNDDALAIATQVATHAEMPTAGADPASIMDYETQVLQNETEDDAIERIRHTFDMYERASQAVINGAMRGLIISGPPGIGKSHGIMQMLKYPQRDSMRALAGDFSRRSEINYEILSGSSSAVGLYIKLYEYSNTNSVLVFDDCDEIFANEESLNLLKAAMDSGAQRTIAWNKKSRVLEGENVPNSFDFNGSVIVLTNIDFERTRSNSLGKHLAAMISRCHYINLEVTTTRDKMLRVKQIVRDGMLEEYQFDNGEDVQIIQYMEDNSEYLYDISLRMVTKLADLVREFGYSWKEIAETTCMKREARFRRLHERHQAEKQVN
jgi:hypothetical protein